MRKDEEVIGGLLDWYFDKVVKEDKFMREFKKKILPILMENMTVRVWWDKSRQE